MTLNYRMMGRDTQISRRRLAVRIPTMKSPLYLTENLPGGQLPLVLCCWFVGLLSNKQQQQQQQLHSSSFPCDTKMQMRGE